VQVHGAPADAAIAGQRTALNLANVSTEDLARGVTLATANIFRPTSRIDARLSLLKSAKPLKDGARVHFHAFTMETIAETRLYGTKLLKPGAEAFAQLKLAEPVLLLPGDRFIIRQFSPVITIGGGIVLDAAVPTRKRRAEETTSFLTTMLEATPEAVLRARVERRGAAGLPLSDVPQEMNIQPDAANQLATSAGVMRYGAVLISHAAFADASARVTQSLKTFHDANPLVAGMGKEELRDRVKLSAEVFAAVLAQAAADKKLTVEGELIHLHGRGVVMKDEEAESKKIIEQAFQSAGLKVPLLKDVLANLKVDKVRAQKIMTLLLRDKVLIKISDDLVFHHSTLADLRKRITALKSTTPKIDVAKFKELTDVSRKYAIPLLEYLDRERVTRRVGDERIIL
jgi:selenocysteine-specific elongation factor